MNIYHKINLINVGLIQCQWEDMRNMVGSQCNETALKINEGQVGRNLNNTKISHQNQHAPLETKTPKRIYLELIYAELIRPGKSWR